MDNEEKNSNMNEEEKKPNMNKSMHYIRILVAGYLLYLSFGIVKVFFTGESGISPWMLLAVVLFVGCSIYFLIFSVRALNRIAKIEKEEAEREAAENPEEEMEIPLPGENKPMSISERARLANHVEVPDGVVDEVEEK